MILPRNAKLLCTISAFAIAIAAFVLLCTSWPKGLIYSECGKTKMLGITENIPRIDSVIIGSNETIVKAVVIMNCSQKFSVENEFSEGEIKANVKPIGDELSKYCTCDRELTLNLPNYPNAKTVALYYDGKLIDKRTISAGAVTDGIEFCESDLEYKPLCYYRLAFMREDAAFCKMTSNQEKCLQELEGFLTLKCLESKSIQNCHIMLANQSNRKK